MEFFNKFTDAVAPITSLPNSPIKKDKNGILNGNHLVSYEKIALIHKEFRTNYDILWGQQNIWSALLLKTMPSMITLANWSHFKKNFTQIPACIVYWRLPI